MGRKRSTIDSLVGMPVRWHPKSKWYIQALKITTFSLAACAAYLLVCSPEKEAEIRKNLKPGAVYCGLKSYYTPDNWPFLPKAKNIETAAGYASADIYAGPEGKLFAQEFTEEGGKRKYAQPVLLENLFKEEH